MSVLAHVLEAAGLTTIALSSVREVADLVKPPRALHCEFPLGRPLGKPLDAEFQTDVLMRAFALLDSTEQVVDSHPVVIETDETPMTCSIPPRFDASLPAAVDEAQGIRAAYDRTLAKRGVSSVGRAIDADGVVGALDVLHQWAEGALLADVPLPGKNTIAVCHDIRTYYEEAALELATGPAAGSRAAEAWFFEQTEAGKTILSARQAAKDQGVRFAEWFYMSPGHR